nr:hypothetical protein [Tanacetum cinerariifolium]
MSINIHKSHLLGIGVSDVSVSEAANRIGCSVMKAPFRYLGIIVGADRSLSGDAPFSMSEPFRKWLGMGAHLPARIQPCSIDHVPFPTVGTCLGASLALREKARRRKKFSLLVPGHRCVHKRGNRNASCSAGVAWSESVARPLLGQRNPRLLGSAALTRSNATAGLGSFQACRWILSPSFVLVPVRVGAQRVTNQRDNLSILAATAAERSLCSRIRLRLIHESGLEELEGIGFNPATGSPYGYLVANERPDLYSSSNLLLMIKRKKRKNWELAPT